MALNNSGKISLGGSTSGESINLELGQLASATISLNDTNVRTLAGVASGQISMPSDFWGKSTASHWISVITGLTSGTAGVPFDLDKTNQRLFVGLVNQIAEINVNTGSIISKAQISTAAAKGVSVSQISTASSANQVILFANVGYSTGTRSSPSVITMPYSLASVTNCFLARGSASLTTLAVYTNGDYNKVNDNLVQGVNYQVANGSRTSGFTVGAAIYGTNPIDSFALPICDQIGNWWSLGCSNMDSASAKYANVFLHGTSITSLTRAQSFPASTKINCDLETDPSNTYSVLTTVVSSSTTLSPLQVTCFNKSNGSTIYWQKQISANCNTQQYTIRKNTVITSSHVYMIQEIATALPAAQNNTYLIVKRNLSDGSLVWQRTVTASGALSYATVGKSIAIDGDNLFIGFMTTVSQAAVIMKLPTDGSKTGSYSVGGYTITYAASSYTDSNVSYAISGGSSVQTTATTLQLAGTQGTAYGSSALSTTTSNI